MVKRNRTIPTRGSCARSTGRCLCWALMPRRRPWWTRSAWTGARSGRGPLRTYLVQGPSLRGQSSRWRMRACTATFSVAGVRRRRARARRHGSGGLGRMLRSGAPSCSLGGAASRRASTLLRRTCTPSEVAVMPPAARNAPVAALAVWCGRTMRSLPFSAVWSPSPPSSESRQQRSSVFPPITTRGRSSAGRWSSARLPSTACARPWFFGTRRATRRMTTTTLP
jgi:hypothetical protein